MKESKEAITRWERQVEELKMYFLLQRTFRNRWRKQLKSSGIFPRIFVVEDSRVSTRFGKNIKPEEFTDRIIVMSMFIDFDWTGKSRKGHWTFLGPGDDKKWYENCNYKPEGE